MTSRKGLIGRLSGSGRSWLPLGEGVLLLWRFVKPMQVWVIAVSAQVHPTEAYRANKLGYFGR